MYKYVKWHNKTVIDLNFFNSFLLNDSICI